MTWGWGLGPHSGEPYGEEPWNEGAPLGADSVAWGWGLGSHSGEPYGEEPWNDA